MAFKITSAVGAEFYILEDNLPKERDFELKDPPEWLLRQHGVKSDNTDDKNVKLTEKAAKEWNDARRATHEQKRLGEAFSVWCDGRKEWPSRKLYKVEHVKDAEALAAAKPVMEKPDPVLVES